MLMKKCKTTPQVLQNMQNLGESKATDRLNSWLFLGPSFLGVFLFFIAPFCVVLYYSFVSGSVNHEFVLFQNYANIIKNAAFRQAVTNTVSFSIAAVPLAVVLALLLHIIFSGLLDVTLPRGTVPFLRNFALWLENLL